MRYFIFFGYDGTNYHGWQIQPNANSVQQELQKALSTLLRRDMEIVGAGRTDTGVHARKMAAHFDWEGEELDAPQLTYRLNRILPRDIAVKDIKRVANDMHARFSASSRTYHYYIHTCKDPFERHYSLQMNFPLDFDRMNQAARHKTTPFRWHWSIIFISIFLSAADFVYFYALSLPGAMISIVSMVRRGSVIVSFLFGAALFHEKNLKAKFVDLLLVLIGMLFLYFGSK